MILDDLKKKYDGKNLADIEDQIETHGKFSLSHRKEFIFGLYYLERTKRYRESARFTASSFETYLRSVFNLAPHKYEEERKAFIAFPEETEKHGVGVVVKVVKECGAVKAAGALKELGKTKNATPERVKQAIAKHAPKKATPEPKVKKVTVDELQAIIHAKDDIILEQNKIIKEQALQIKRLKAALSKAQQPVIPGILNTLNNPSNPTPGLLSPV